MAVLTEAETEFLDEMRRRFPTKLSRLRGGFYDIKNKEGAQTPFKMNEDQEEFMAARHILDLLLKSRQKGFTTLIQLDMLDDCLFIPNTAGGEVPCFTCKGVGSVDPGNPPYAPGWRGGLRIGWKIFFGGG